MRLTKLDIDKSMIVRLDRSIRSDGVNGVMTFGERNDYPQLIESIVNNSVTAKSAVRVYAKFLTGQGFEAPGLNGIQVGRDKKGKKITLRGLLSQIAMSTGMFNGFYIHCNYTRDGKIHNASYVPFKFCRFAKVDDLGYTARIGVYDNWEKAREKNFNKGKIAWYNVFNPDKKIITSQIQKAGDIKHYNGQIYFCFLDDTYLYPLAPMDPVYMDADTEYQLQLFKNRSIRNGLMDKTVMRIQSPANDKERDELVEGIKKFMGADGDSVLVLEDEVEPQTGEVKTFGAFKLDQIKSNINSRLFENWGNEITNNIRKSMFAMPAILIEYENSKLGTTSGEAIKQATEFYNAITQDDRAMISEVFAELFQDSTINGLAGNTNWNIKPLNLYGNGTSTNVQPAAGD